MNTREIAIEYRLSHWAGIMQERNASGLSIKAFCKTAGIHENVYYYWQRKLREAACEHLAVPQGASETGLSTMGFAEVKLAVPSSVPALPESPHRGQLSIEYGEVRITADSAYPQEKLASLLRELMRPC